MKKARSFISTPKVATAIVHSIADAGEQIEEEIDRENFATGDGTPGRFWDFVNTNLRDRLGFVDCMTHVKDRGCWEMMFIYDPNSKYIYTIMREKRFSQLCAERHIRKNMHYMDILSRYVNSDLLAPQGQLSFEPVTFQDGDRLKEKFADLLQDFMDKKSVIKRYVLILFDESQFELHSVRAVTVDSNLDIVDQSDWSAYIPVRESIVVSIESDPHDPNNNPTRGLKFKKEAISKKKKAALKAIESKQSNIK